MARDWAKLRRASFRGVAFHVEGEQPEVGRRIVVHEVSGGEANPTEDMGAAASYIAVDAYVTGDQADAAGLALEAACAAAGPAMLQLPVDLPIMAHCRMCRRDRFKDRNGMVAYSLEFTPYVAMSAGVASGTGALKTVLDAGLAGLGASMAGLF